jgi:hypothetical protein
MAIPTSRAQFLPPGLDQGDTRGLVQMLQGLLSRAQLPGLAQPLLETLRSGLSADGLSASSIANLQRQMLTLLQGFGSAAPSYPAPDSQGAPQSLQIDPYMPAR